MQSSPYLSSQYSYKGRKEDGNWKPMCAWRHHLHICPSFLL